jgi:hypothetical protein
MWKQAIMAAVFKLTDGDPTRAVSFADIASAVASEMDLEADSHDRGGIYNKVVITTKQLIDDDNLLGYMRDPIAGHPAWITINFETGVRRKQPTLFDIVGDAQ